MANEIEERNEAFLIYQDENGIARVNVRFEGEDVWLNVEQMMELFDASQQDISYHIKQIYAEGEQASERTHKKFLLVRQEYTGDRPRVFWKSCFINPNEHYLSNRGRTKIKRL